MRVKLGSTLVTVGLILSAVVSGWWAASLGEPAGGHPHIDTAVVLWGLGGAMAIAFLLGAGLRGPWGALVNLNRIIAWPMAFGYVWVHYAFHMEHGEPGGLAALHVVPRVFFVVSFVWIAFHAGVAAQLYGAPWKLRPKTVHDWYVALSWLVLLVTIPVFSVPALGASPVWMAIAWAIFAPHIVFNMFHMVSRTPVAWLNRGPGRIAIVVTYAGAVAIAAVNSFPK
ncbi:MAG TPA: hypothetical protein VK139_06735 [Microbacteriaceae bacterium]|nr:hypothetical protein [Microbacteriaceae bacterium]